MADRVSYFYKQTVTSDELNEGFDKLEQADRDLAADLSWNGFLTGGIAAQRTPATMTIDIAGPTVGYDSQGRRVSSAGTASVDVSFAEGGIPTAVTVTGKERYVSVFIRFKRVLSDPRSDGNNQQVYYQQEEGYELVVRVGAEANAGAAVRPSLVAGELLVCDILRTFGQSSITNSTIDATRRTQLSVTDALRVSASTADWDAWLQAGAGTDVQNLIDKLADVLSKHVTGEAHKHAGEYITRPAYSWLTATNVTSALQQIVEELTASGGDRVGINSFTEGVITIPDSSLTMALRTLAQRVANHFAGTHDKHASAAITRTDYSWVEGTTVEAALQNIANNLGSGVTNSSGASRVAMEAYSSGDISFTSGNLVYFLKGIIDRLNYAYVHPIDIDRFLTNGATVDWQVNTSYGYLTQQITGTNTKSIRIPIRVPVGKRLRRVEVYCRNTGHSYIPASGSRLKCDIGFKEVGSLTSGLQGLTTSGTATTLEEYDVATGYTLTMNCNLLMEGNKCAWIEVTGEPYSVNGEYNMIMGATAYIF